MELQRRRQRFEDSYLSWFLKNEQDLTRLSKLFPGNCLAALKNVQDTAKLKGIKHRDIQMWEKMKLKVVMKLTSK